MILYLHDTPFSVGDKIAANRSNSSEISSIDKFLSAQGEVLLSADDGYKSVKNLLPLLERYKVKLILFVTSGFLDRSVYPYEVELSNFLQKHDALTYGGEKFILETASSKENFFNLFHQRLKFLTLDERERSTSAFFSENGCERQKYREEVFLTWDELRELESHPLVEIGSHCVSHVFLPTQDLSTIIFELKESKARIESELGKKVTKLSYPYGGNNFKVKALARALGYKEAYGTNDKKHNFMDKGRMSLG
ncbi:MAG: polysaccharide deacetylase family protein [Pseudomonadota bacterium]